MVLFLLMQNHLNPDCILIQKMIYQLLFKYQVLMEQDKVQTLFIRAMHAARRRAGEMGDEFGKS